MCCSFDSCVCIPVCVLCVLREQNKLSKVANIKVTVLGAKNVPPVDSDSADPFVTLKLAGTKFQTKVLKKTLTPVWNETFSWKEVRVENDPLVFKMIDHNFFKDKAMGQCTIDLKNVQITAGRTRPDDLKFEHKVSAACPHTGHTATISTSRRSRIRFNLSLRCDVL